MGEGVIFQIPVMTIPPPQSCPSGSPCPGILPSSALPSPSAPVLNSRSIGQMQMHAHDFLGWHARTVACIERDRRVQKPTCPYKVSRHTDIPGNTCPHSQTHRFRETQMCSANRTISLNRAPINDSQKCTHLHRVGQTLSLSWASTGTGLQVWGL